MNFNNLMIDWVTIDNQQREYLDKLKEIREKKMEVSDQLIEHIKKNELESNIFNITDLNTNVQLSKRNIQEGLTYNLVEECLHEYLNDESKTSDIINLIKNKRGKTVKYNLIRK